MKDEIKEIEEWLRDISTPTGLSYSGDRTLSNSMVDHIIDYITNLQEKNEKQHTQNARMKKEIGILCNRLDARNKQVEKAINKLQTMFDNGNEQTILDDLLELNRILNGADE